MQETCCKECGGLLGAPDAQPSLKCDCPFIPLQEEDEEDEEMEWEE